MRGYFQVNRWKYREDKKVLRPTLYDWDLQRESPGFVLKAWKEAERGSSCSCWQVRWNIRWRCCICPSRQLRSDFQLDWYWYREQNNRIHKHECYFIKSSYCDLDCLQAKVLQRGRDPGARAGLEYQSHRSSRLRESWIYRCYWR
jgi:hypothetical protein